MFSYIISLLICHNYRTESIDNSEVSDGTLISPSSTCLLTPLSSAVSTPQQSPPAVAHQSTENNNSSFCHFFASVNGSESFAHRVFSERINKELLSSQPDSYEGYANELTAGILDVINCSEEANTGINIFMNNNSETPSVDPKILEYQTIFRAADGKSEIHENNHKLNCTNTNNIIEKTLDDSVKLLNENNLNIPNYSVPFQNMAEVDRLAWSSTVTAVEANPRLQQQAGPSMIGENLLFGLSNFRNAPGIPDVSQAGAYNTDANTLIGAPPPQSTSFPRCGFLDVSSTDAGDLTSAIPSVAGRIGDNSQWKQSFAAAPGHSPGPAGCRV